MTPSKKPFLEAPKKKKISVVLTGQEAPQMKGYSAAAVLELLTTLRHTLLGWILSRKSKLLSPIQLALLHYLEKQVLW